MNHSKTCPSVRQPQRILTSLLILGLGSLSATASADSKKTKQPAASSAPAEQSIGDMTSSPNGTGAEKVNVDNIKEKYWARGDESELGVVQNRLYSKEKKFDLGLFGGISSSDPFLSTKTLGGTLGFHFNETFGVHLIGFKSFTSPSSALETLRLPTPVGIGSDTNVNYPEWFAGTEVTGSFLYGKLSLIGKAIIHYDMHLLAGMGLTGTQSGNYFTPYAGIGQRFYVSKVTSLRIDYRLMYFNETILKTIPDAINPETVGQPIGSRANWTNSITIGVDFMVNIFGKK